MKKIILCLTLCASAGLFGASSSSSSESGDFHQMPREESREYAQELLKSSRIFLGHYEPTNKTIHHTYDPQISRHEKNGLLEQATETAVHVSAQTFFGLLIHDLYAAGKNYFIPNGEAAFQENVANLQLLKAHNSEKEREANIQIMQEIRELITIVRKLNTEAKQRKLSPEEQTELSSAQNSLALLQGIIAAAA